jgi:hypothetical protein
MIRLSKILLTIACFCIAGTHAWRLLHGRTDTDEWIGLGLAVVLGGLVLKQTIRVPDEDRDPGLTEMILWLFAGVCSAVGLVVMGMQLVL